MRICLYVLRVLVLSLAVVVCACSNNSPPDTSTDSSTDTSVDPAVCEPGEIDVEVILSELEGLEIDLFFEQSFEELMLLSPEGITSDGLSESLGLRDDQLDNISDSFKTRTHELRVGIFELLENYDQDSLSEEQQISFDVYHWMLSDLIDGWEFRYHDYPVSHFIDSPQNHLIRFFRDVHPVTNLGNAQDYITRLGQVDNKMACLVENIELSREAGIIPLRFMLEMAADQTREVTDAAPQTLSLYTEFESKLQNVEGLTENEKIDLLAGAAQEIETSVIPGFDALLEKIEELIEIAPQEGGAWQLPDGDAYYEYSLVHHSTTSLKPDEIYELGLSEIDRITAQIRQLAQELGYPPDDTMTMLFDRVTADSGIIATEDIVPTYEQIINDALNNLYEAFDIYPEIDVIVIGGAAGGFYMAGAEDGSRPGAFYAYNLSPLPWYNMPSLTYHETVPGHHFQIGISQMLDLPSFRKRASGCTGYVEGWALYAEQLVYELGFYDGDVYGDLGRLQYELYRAVRLVVDTGIHHRGWTFDEAADYFADKTGYSYATAQGQIARYLVLPGQAVSYKIGMLKILELRQQSEIELGGQFDIKDFHREVLTKGRVPLDTLEMIIESYIDNTLGTE